MLSRLDRRIRAMKGWIYWSLVGMLAAAIIGALVVITSRVLVGPMGVEVPSLATARTGAPSSGLDSAAACQCQLARWRGSGEPVNWYSSICGPPAAAALFSPVRSRADLLSTIHQALEPAHASVWIPQCRE